MKGLESYIHIFIFTFTCTPRSLMPGYETPESILHFHKAILGISIPSHHIHLEERQKERKYNLGKHASYFSNVFKDVAIGCPHFLSTLQFFLTDVLSIKGEAFVWGQEVKGRTVLLKLTYCPTSNYIGKYIFLPQVESYKCLLKFSVHKLLKSLC